MLPNPVADPGETSCHVKSTAPATATLKLIWSFVPEPDFDKSQRVMKGASTGGWLMFGVGSSFSIAFALTAKSDKKKKE
jgi:hypothetical protein